MLGELRVHCVPAAHEQQGQHGKTKASVSESAHSSPLQNATQTSATCHVELRRGRSARHALSPAASVARASSRKQFLYLRSWGGSQMVSQVMRVRERRKQDAQRRRSRATKRRVARGSGRQPGGSSGARQLGMEGLNVSKSE